MDIEAPCLSTVLAGTPKQVTSLIPNAENGLFSRFLFYHMNLQPEEYIAAVRRMGLICFRMAMLLAALRIMEDGNVSESQQCRDTDFDSVLDMVGVLIRLPEEISITKKANKKEQFLEALPVEFSTQDYFKIAQELNISDKTAERYVSGFVKSQMLIREGHGKYKNPTKK